MSPYAFEDGEGESVDELSGVIEKETLVFKELLARSNGKMHPNVVDLVSHFELAGDEAKKAGFLMPDEAYEKPVHFFVTEFLGGGSLGDEIKRRQESCARFEEQEVLDVAVSVSEGLRFLHAKGIAHRDIKPDNLVYSQSQKELKLIDFSVSDVASQQEKHMHKAFRGSVGTEGFAAPEVHLEGMIDGPKGYGPSCDIFSLGCVLHEMLAGELPEVELFPDSPGKKARVICDLGDLPQAISVETQRLVESMLAENPAHRPTASDIYNNATALKCS